MTTREARTLLATLPLAAHALIRCRYCRTLWIETR